MSFTVTNIQKVAKSELSTSAAIFVPRKTSDTALFDQKSIEENNKETDNKPSPTSVFDANLYKNVSRFKKFFVISPKNNIFRKTKKLVL